MINQSLRTGTVERFVELEATDHYAINMFPYKIKNRELFYDRNHPKNINPYSGAYDRYWSEFTKKCIEGKWVEDKDRDGNSTWVYMPPKLFFYINYITIFDKKRRPIQPRLRDNAWIIATYYFILDGFSGFEGDDKYTCNDFVRRIENVEHNVDKKIKESNELADWELKRLDKMDHLKNPKTGQYKMYVDPWIYLTEHYLINDQRGKPLGLPIYDNQRQNGIVLAARACEKSYYTYMGDFLHELLLSGVRSVEDIKYINDKILFAVASKDPDPLSRTLSDIENALASQPGKYSMLPEYGGALYKKMGRGAWEIVSGKKKKSHQVKRQNGTFAISGNEVQIITIQDNKPKIVAGGRMRRIVIEEVGFVRNLTAIHSACNNTLKVDQDFVGSLIGIGTGGESEDIEAAKTMYENPLGYNVASIPDYYNKVSKKSRTALFLSVVYQSEDFKDPQGNTILKEALKHVIKERVKEKANKDADSFLRSIMFNPLYPKEMLIPKGKNRFPTLQMSNFRNELLSSNFMQSSMRKGWFNWNPLHTRGVEFKVDLENKRQPLYDWGKEDKVDSLEGAFLMYEDVIDDPPTGLYYVIVDPVAISGNGSSQNSVLVYKADYVGSDQMRRDTIVGEWTGRHDQITDTYEFIVMITKYYKAQIFQETNVHNFLEWCSQNEYFDLLYPEPRLTLDFVYKKPTKPSFYGRGVRMTKQLNQFAYIKLADWLKEVTDRNENGIPTKHKFEELTSLRLMSECINYDPDMKTQFDGVSSLYLLMILRSELHYQELEIEIDGNEEDGYYEEYDQENLIAKYGRQEVEQFIDW